MLSDYQTLVDSFVQDTSGNLDAAARDTAIDLARIRYSDDRPLEMVEDIATDESEYLPLPTAWQESFSRLLSVKVDDDPVIVRRVRLPIGERLLLRDNLRTGETVTVTYTTVHTLDGATDTIPLFDREAVASYAASLLLDQLSSLYAGHRSSAYEADTVDYQSKSREYSGRAKTLRQRYLDHLGLDRQRTAPAGVVVDLDRRDSRGRDRLVHRQGRR